MIILKSNTLTTCWKTGLRAAYLATRIVFLLRNRAAMTPPSCCRTGALIFWPTYTHTAKHKGNIKSGNRKMEILFVKAQNNPQTALAGRVSVSAISRDPERVPQSIFLPSSQAQWLQTELRTPVRATQSPVPCHDKSTTELNDGSYKAGPHAMQGKAGECSLQRL